jgi:hypothetical protein
MSGAFDLYLHGDEQWLRGGSLAGCEVHRHQRGAGAHMSDVASTGFAATGFNSKATWFGI